jgi:hypothetical protein
MRIQMEELKEELSSAHEHLLKARSERLAQTNIIEDLEDRLKVPKTLEKCELTVPESRFSP